MGWDIQREKNDPQWMHDSLVSMAKEEGGADLNHNSDLDHNQNSDLDLMYGKAVYRATKHHLC